MPFLLRLALPDVPGSLGRVASAIGEAGGDIEAIEIVEKGHDGTAVDDVFLEMVDGAMPDQVVSACTGIEGVEVLWISRYAAGGNVFLDLEAVESMTAHADEAYDRFVDLLPVVFRSDWGARVGPDGVRHATSAAPADLTRPDVREATRIDDAGDSELRVAAPLDGEEVVVIGRRGGPVFLDSELARLEHLANLARTIAS